MMKQTVSQKSQKIQSLDGPPLDFSFKSIRTLQELETVANAKPVLKQTLAVEQKIGQSKKATQSVINNAASENQINQGAAQTKLNIIRTIQIMDNKILETSKNGFNKKQEKVESKNVKHVESKTSSLFLRYNKILTIEGLYATVQKIFPHPQQLIWIDLSHNRLTNLVQDFQQFPQLKNLYLHANYINSFKQIQKLQGVKLLRTFTIHGNPVQNFSEFRVLISCILPQIQKIDSNLLTKRQRQRGEVLIKQNKKYPQIPNPLRPPQESDNQEEN